MDWFIFIHYFLHYLFPGFVAYGLADRLKIVWWKIYLVLLSSSLIDLDHLLADPIFDPERCSIGFHPLHSWPFVFVYIGMVCFPNVYVRLFGVGALFHLLVDFVDCYI
jgi:hypothetical protein